MVRVFEPSGQHSGYFNPSDTECWGHVRDGQTEFTRLYRLPSGTWVLWRQRDDPEASPATIVATDEARQWRNEHGISGPPNSPLNLAIPRSGNEQMPALRLTIVGQIVLLDGIPIPLEQTEAGLDDAILFLKTLIEAFPNWVSSRNMQLDSRGDIVKKKLPKELRKLIEGKPRKGYRLRPSAMRN
jgi:hypothetical protein